MIEVKKHGKKKGRNIMSQKKMIAMAEEFNMLSEFEQKLIQYAYRSFSMRKKAKTEENTILQNSYLSLASIRQETSELRLLQNYLSDFLGSKKLKESLLKADELIYLIQNEIKLHEERITDHQNIIDDVREMEENKEN